MRLTQEEVRTALRKINAETAKTITGATIADPSVITSEAHGFETGDTCVIYGVGGMPELVGVVSVTKIDADTFSVAIEGTGTYTSGGKIARINSGLTPTDLENLQDTLDRTNINPATSVYAQLWSAGTV